MSVTEPPLVVADIAGYGRYLDLRFVAHHDSFAAHEGTGGSPASIEASG